MSDKPYDEITTQKGVPVKCWTRGVSFEAQARRQLFNVAQMPFVHSHVAAPWEHARGH